MSTNRVNKLDQRQGDYSNVGYAGRKTGVVLKHTEARDQYGMPALDDLFSSPQRPVSPVKAKAQTNGVAEAVGAVPLGRTSVSPRISTQYSSPRKPIPPRARSPIKTSIGSPRKSLNGSPTKTMGLLASPVRIGNHGRSRVGGMEDTTSDAFANNRHKRRSLEQAPKRPSAPMSGSKPHLQAPRKSLFELPSSPAVRQLNPGLANGRTSLEQSPAIVQRTSPRLRRNEQSKTSPAVIRSDLSPINGTAGVSEEEQLFVNQDHTSPLLPRIRSNGPPSVPAEPSPQILSNKAKGKRRLNDIEAEESSRNSKNPLQPVVQLPAVEEEFDGAFGGFDDYDAGAKINEEIEEDTDQPAVVEEEYQPPILTRSPSKPSPRVKKSQEAISNTRSPKRPPDRRSPLQEDQEEISPQPAKRRRISPTEAMPPPQRPIARPITKQPPARQPKERDANIAMMFGKTKSKQSAVPAQPVPPPRPPLGKSRPKGRGLQIMKEGTEPEIDGARYTRSGRTSVKPVEYWRGERIIYTEPKREGGRVSLPGIKEVIRVDDEPDNVRSKTKRKPTASRKRQPSVESEEEDDDAEQDWEMEPGVFAGELPSWDSIEQRGDPENPEQVDLAIAPRGLELLTRQAEGTQFQFAKTLTLPFFHSGMVDLPPGGEKRTKNSRRNHIVFWVFSGRVMVDVSGNEFSLGRGGMWQVPRGNTYGLTNPYDKPARIFFAQGCYMTEAEGEAYEEGEAAGPAQE